MELLLRCRRISKMLPLFSYLSIVFVLLRLSKFLTKGSYFQKGPYLIVSLNFKTSSRRFIVFDNVNLRKSQKNFFLLSNPPEN